MPGAVSRQPKSSRASPGTAPTNSSAETPVPAWRKFLAQFTDVLVLLLIAAAHIRRCCGSTSGTPPLPYEAHGDPRHRAAQRRHGLRAGGARRSGAWRRCARWRRREATVVRDGQPRSVPAAEVVPGDIILIEEGDTIPADGAADRVDRAADRRSRADRREPAGLEGHRRRSPRRPALGDRAQHGVQRHGGDLRARAGRGDGDRHADRDGPHRRHAARRRPSETTPLQQELDRVGKLLGIVVVVIAVVMIATILLVEDVARVRGALSTC